MKYTLVNLLHFYGGSDDGKQVREIIFLFHRSFLNYSIYDKEVLPNNK